MPEFYHYQRGVRVQVDEASCKDSNIPTKDGHTLMMFANDYEPGAGIPDSYSGIRLPSGNYAIIKITPEGGRHLFFEHALCFTEETFWSHPNFFVLLRTLEKHFTTDILEKTPPSLNVSSDKIKMPQVKDAGQKLKSLLSEETFSQLLSSFFLTVKQKPNNKFLSVSIYEGDRAFQVLEYICALMPKVLARCFTFTSFYTLKSEAYFNIFKLGQRPSKARRFDEYQIYFQAKSSPDSKKITELAYPTIVEFILKEIYGPESKSPRLRIAELIEWENKFFSPDTNVLESLDRLKCRITYESQIAQNQIPDLIKDPPDVLMDHQYGRETVLERNFTLLEKSETDRQKQDLFHYYLQNVIRVTEIVSLEEESVILEDFPENFIKWVLYFLKLPEALSYLENKIFYLLSPQFKGNASRTEIPKLYLKKEYLQQIFGRDNFLSKAFIEISYKLDESNVTQYAHIIQLLFKLSELSGKEHKAEAQKNYKEFLQQLSPYLLESGINEWFSIYDGYFLEIEDKKWVINLFQVRKLEKKCLEYIFDNFLPDVLIEGKWSQEEPWFTPLLSQISIPFKELRKEIDKFCRNHGKELPGIEQKKWLIDILDKKDLKDECLQYLLDGFLPHVLKEELWDEVHQFTHFLARDFEKTLPKLKEISSVMPLSELEQFWNKLRELKLPTGTFCEVYIDRKKEMYRKKKDEEKEFFKNFCLFNIINIEDPEELKYHIEDIVLFVEHEKSLAPLEQLYLSMIKKSPGALLNSQHNFLDKIYRSITSLTSFSSFEVFKALVSPLLKPLSEDPEKEEEKARRKSLPIILHYFLQNVESRASKKDWEDGDIKLFQQLNIIEKLSPEDYEKLITIIIKNYHEPDIVKRFKTIACHLYSSPHIYQYMNTLKDMLAKARKEEKDEIKLYLEELEREKKKFWLVFPLLGDYQKPPQNKELVGPVREERKLYQYSKYASIPQVPDREFGTGGLIEKIRKVLPWVLIIGVGIICSFLLVLMFLDSQLNPSQEGKEEFQALINKISHAPNNQEKIQVLRDLYTKFRYTDFFSENRLKLKQLEIPLVKETPEFFYIYAQQKQNNKNKEFERTYNFKDEQELKDFVIFEGRLLTYFQVAETGITPPLDLALKMPLPTTFELEFEFKLASLYRCISFSFLPSFSSSKGKRHKFEFNFGTSISIPSKVRFIHNEEKEDVNFKFLPHYKDGKIHIKVIEKVAKITIYMMDQEWSKELQIGTSCRYFNIKSGDIYLTKLSIKGKIDESLQKWMENNWPEYKEGSDEYVSKVLDEYVSKLSKNKDIKKQ